MSIRLVVSHWGFAQFIIHNTIFAIYTLRNTKIEQKYKNTDDFKREMLFEKNSSLRHNLILKF